MDNGDIGRITPAGAITTCTTGISGGIEGLTAGPDESMWFTESAEDRIGKITATGTGFASNCTGATGSTGSTGSSGSTGSTGSTTTTPPATPPATGTVSLDGSILTVQSSGVATVKLTCTGTATCAGTLTLAAKGKAKKGKKAKTEQIGTAGFSIAPGTTQAVKLKLNGTGRALLGAAHGHLSATLTILKSSPSPSASAAQSIRLNQQKAKKKK